MAKIRNTSPDVVIEGATKRVLEPDQVVTIPDEWADAYEGHPIFELVPDPPAPKHKAAPAPAGAADTTNVTEEVSQ